MTGLLLFTILVALIVFGLAPARGRSRLGHRLGAETRNDRDRARIAADLTAAAQHDS